jgi:hypothetical protein
MQTSPLRNTCSFAAKAATPGMLAVGLEATIDFNYPMLAAFVALKYSFNKMRHMSYTQEWSSLPASTPERRMKTVLDYGSKGAAVLAVLNTVLFFAGGEYSSILYRLIGFKMVSELLQRTSSRCRTAITIWSPGPLLNGPHHSPPHPSQPHIPLPTPPLAEAHQRRSWIQELAAVRGEQEDSLDCSAGKYILHGEVLSV